MLVDGVVVFGNGVESYGICKEFDYISVGIKAKRVASSLMMGQ